MDISALDGVVFVDLTVPISHDVPALWPGNPEMHFDTFHWFDEEPPYFNRLLHVDEHVGTHWDAPSHFLEDHRERGLYSTENVPLEKLMVPAAVIDASDLVGDVPGVSPRVGVARVEAWEAEHGRLQPGDGVLLRTGWSDRYFKPFPEGLAFAQDVIDRKAPAWPAFDVEATELLADRGVVLFGFDVPSAGPWDDVARLHRVALERNIVLVENLTGMGPLPARGALFIFLPLKLRDGSGAPGRAVAIMPAP